MASLYINNNLTRFISISDIVDSLSANEGSFTVELLGYTTANRLGKSAEIYGFSNNLLGIGNVRKESVKIGIRPRSTLEIVGYSAFLNWYPISGRFSGRVQDILTALIIAAQMDQVLIGARFLTSDDAKNAQVSFTLDNQYLGQAIQQLLGLSGYQLTYRIPISEKIIEINQPGYGNPAPIPEITIDNLYQNCGLGLQRPIQYSIIPPIASKIIVYGRNGLRSIGNGSFNPLDILKYTSNGETQFGILKSADELIKVLVTQPTPIIAGCTTEVILSGSNYDIVNQLYSYNYYLPTVSTDPVSYVYTADITNIKQSSNVSFYIDGTIDTTEGNLRITFEGTEIFNRSLSSLVLARTMVMSLRAYEGQNGQIIATITLDAQPTTNTSYRLFLEADCCAIETFAGTGVAGFNGDNLSKLATQFNNPTKVHVDSNGDIYVADNLNYLMRKIDAITGIVSIIGGNGNAAITLPSDGGTATSQDFGQIRDFVIVGTNIYLILADWVQVAKIDLTNGNYYLIDDNITALDEITGISADSEGNIYYGVGDESVIYKLVGETTRTIYAGLFGIPGFSGDGGLATSAEISRTNGLEFDSEDNLYLVAERVGQGRNVIRKVTRSTGIISTPIGDGSVSVLGVDAASYKIQDGRGLSISIDKVTNDIYFINDGIILKIDTTTNIIDRFAGISDATGDGFEGDKGSPITSLFDFYGAFFGGLHVVDSTHIYIADENNNRIRKILCGDMGLADCPDTTLISTNTASNVINGYFGTLLDNPFPIYNAGNSGAPTIFSNSIDISTSFDIDLTDIAFAGHTVQLDILLTTSANSTGGGNDLSITASITMQGNTIYSIADSETLSSAGNMSRSFSSLVDVSAYIGEVLTITTSAVITASIAASTFYVSEFTAEIIC